MTIAWVGSGGRTSGATSPLATAYPSGLSSGDLLVLFCWGKYYDNFSWDTPSGWTQLADVDGGYDTGTGNDRGTGSLAIFIKESTGSESGSLNVTFTGTINVGMTEMVAYSKTTGTWATGTTTGSQNSVSTNWSLSGLTDPGITAGDMMLLFFGINGNVHVSVSNQSITSSGVTFGSVTERIDDTSSTGNDAGTSMAEVPVSSGTSSTTCTIGASFASSAAYCPAGAVVGLRLREDTGGTPTNETASAARAMQVTAANVLTASGSATASLAKAVTAAENVTVDEAVTLTRAMQTTAASSTVTEESATISRAMQVTADNDTAKGGATSATRAVQVTAAENVIAGDALTASLQKAVSVTENVTVEETVNIARVMQTTAAAAGTTIEESVTLSRAMQTATVSGLVVDETVTITRANQASDGNSLTADETATITKAVQAIASELATLGGSVTLSRAMQVLANAGPGTTEESVALARIMQAVSASTVNVDSSATLSRAMQVTAAGVAGETDESVTLSRAMQVASQSDRISNATLSLAIARGITNATNTVENELIILGRNAIVSPTDTINIDEAILLEGFFGITGSVGHKVVPVEYMTIPGRRDGPGSTGRKQIIVLPRREINVE